MSLCNSYFLNIFTKNYLLVGIMAVIFSYIGIIVFNNIKCKNEYSLGIYGFVLVINAI